MKKKREKREKREREREREKAPPLIVGIRRSAKWLLAEAERRERFEK